MRVQASIGGDHLIRQHVLRTCGCSLSVSEVTPARDSRHQTEKNWMGNIVLARGKIYLLLVTFSFFALPLLNLLFPSLSNSAATISGNPTVASTKTSPN